MNPEKIYEDKIRQLEIELQKVTDTLHNYKKEHDEFILIASHDLQSPLRKLSTFAERLSNKIQDLPDEAKTYIDRIQAAADSMRSLVDGLGMLSEVTETTNKFQRCDLNEVMQTVLNNIQHGEEVAITCSGLPVIEGNCTQLLHLFQNVLDNAIKFQKKDTPLQLVISAEKINEQEKNDLDLPADKTYHKIEISDNGIGFENQYSEKIFQPFQRLHGKSEYAGNGLGLAICKKIMDKHRGLIYAKSDNNDGALFVLILPETSE